MNIQIPEINLPDYFKNADQRILVFDDLERSKIDISNILGYINYFVEHQGLKVIIVANEDELIKNSSYKVIKEKLIGKTFGVSLDFEKALNHFIDVANNLTVKEFLTKNTDLIEDLYNKAEYENLRNLKQIVLDFERIFEILPQKAKNEPELLQDILKLLMAFSIEIKRGEMLPKDIGKLQEEYVSGVSKQVIFHPEANSVTNTKENYEEQTSLQKILNRYPLLALYEPFPSKEWWQTFFDKGILDRQELNQSLSSSKYFQDENTPNWIKLWHFSYLNDDEFDNLLRKVESEYEDRQFVHFGEIKHIFGLFLRFSDAGLYYKSKGEILNDSKLYIDYLRDSNNLDIDVASQEDYLESVYGTYRNLGFQGREFTEFSSYISEVIELAKIEDLPSAGKKLLITMQNDTLKFSKMICINNFSNEDGTNQKYSNIPILKYIEPYKFVEELLPMKFEDRRCIGWALTERYEFDNINEKLLEELDWLKSVRSLLLEEADRRKGKVSGYSLKLINEHFLNKVIETLELKKS